MSVLNAFLSTWSNARQTFGEGTPQTGEQYDNSGTLRGLKSTVESAAPGSKWTGGAANAYGAANTEHARVFEQLAGLDQRLAGHVGESAQVVAAGRRDLDSIRKWVVDAAASTPQGQAGEQMRLAIVQKGIAQVQDVIQRSNGELNTIGGKIRGLDGEYQALGNQKFAKEGPAFATGKESEDAEAKRRQAEKDVHDALAGDQEAAKRVEDALKGIQPGRPLSAEQGSYLSQMQAQQHGMSVDALKTAEQRLGDQKHIIGDSWQLMSNPNVDFPKTETKVGALDDANTRVKGAFSQLPQSVQDTLNAPDVQGAKNLQTIAGVVKDGDDGLQTNTELDRAMLKKTATMMDTPFWQQSAEEYNVPPDQRLKWLDPVVSDTFSAVSPDHQAVHNAITAGPGHIDGINSDKFMEGLTHRIWADGGAGAGDLFEWTKNTSGPEAGIAADTAEAYGKYLGLHGDKLLDLPGHHTVGEINPKLVQAFGEGLAPYQGAMVGDPAANHGFDPLDGLGTDMPNTRNLFAVIDSDPTAAKQFNGDAYLRAAEYESNFAHTAASDPVVDGTDPHHDDLRKAGRLLGLVDAGADIETRSHVTNQQQSAYEHAKAAWELKNTAYESIMNNIPGGDRVAAALQDGAIGKEPQESDYPPGSYTTDVGPHGDQRALGNATTQAQYTIAQAMVDGPNADIPSNYFRDGVLMTPAEVRAQYGEFGWEDYSSKLQAYIAKYPSLSAASTEFQFTFGTVAGIGPVQPPK